MNSVQRLAALTILLTAPALICPASSSDSRIHEVADCQPEITPQENPNATLVALQFHQWMWIENLTSPDWGPRADSGGMLYEFLRPGFVRQQRLPLLVFLKRNQFVYINVSFVTNGDTLCTAALTQYRNKTSGDLDTTSCSRICRDNFTTVGTRVNLPLLVYDDLSEMSRYSEYLAFDAVDPDSRAAYTCMGHFKQELMSSLPNLMRQQKRCSDGDECLFNYNTQGSFVDAGCKRDFQEYSWCVSDVNLCSYNIDGICPVCCRGDLCNRGVAQKAYKLWLEGRGASSIASSIWMLTSCALSLLFLRLYI